MAKHRPNVPPATKAALRAQVGGKCANPGCPVARTHLHHIREWAVYQSHDDEHMIAVCPTCHDAIHHGELPVDDETLYRWKSITRTDAARRGHLYVEPSREAKLFLGSISVTGDAGLVVFELSEGNRLSFALQDGEIVLLSLTVTDSRGWEVVRLVDGHVKVAADTGVEYEHVPGHHRITARHEPRYLPGWVLSRVQGTDPGFDPSDGVVLLDLEVIASGIVKVEGVWIEGRKGHGVVVTVDDVHELILRALAQDKSLVELDSAMLSVIMVKCHEVADVVETEETGADEKAARCAELLSAVSDVGRLARELEAHPISKGGAADEGDARVEGTPTLSAVEVLSMIGAKGLSAKHVIVLGCDDRNMPRTTPLEFYVALSRARETLHLVTSLRARGATAAHPYIYDIPEEYCEYVAFKRRGVEPLAGRRGFRNKLRLLTRHRKAERT